MKKTKLFPKTFLYLFSLMAVIASISHALFYFLMPAVYTARKENSFRAARDRLCEELTDAMPDRIQQIVSQYAVRERLGVFVNYDGAIYNYLVDGAPSADGADLRQEVTVTRWNVPAWCGDTAAECLPRDFYTRTASQLLSGSYFDTADGKRGYLLLIATLQPVSEAKEAVIVFLPLTLLLSLLLSAVFAFLYSGKISRPLSEISEMTERMKALDPSAECRVASRDEIGMLSDNINTLYQTLLATIDSLQKENARVTEAEAAKVDFLRAASHELKTPVTALRGMLDNMIMGIGRYRDWETYLPVCRDAVKRFGVMIQEILDASRLNFSFESEEKAEVRMRPFAERVLAPYALIAKSRGIVLDTDFSSDFSADFPEKAMEKVLPNIFSNAVKYTEPSGRVKVRLGDGYIVVENECEPIPGDVLPHIFEPFYRPDFSRSRSADGENPEGGNGLGLYIAKKILDTLGLSFSFGPFDSSDGSENGGMRFTVYFC